MKLGMALHGPQVQAHAGGWGPLKGPATRFRQADSAMQ